MTDILAEQKFTVGLKAGGAARSLYSGAKP